jgi:hypothetical protein
VIFLKELTDGFAEKLLEFEKENRILNSLFLPTVKGTIPKSRSFRLFWKCGNQGTMMSIICIC